MNFNVFTTQRILSKLYAWKHSIEYVLTGVNPRHYVNISINIHAIRQLDRGRFRMGAELSYGYLNDAGNPVSDPVSYQSIFREVSFHAVEEYLEIVRSGKAETAIIKAVTELAVKTLRWNECWRDPERPCLPVLRFIDDGAILETTNRYDGGNSGPGRFILEGAQLKQYSQGDLWEDIFGTLRSWRDLPWLNMINGTTDDLAAVIADGIKVEGFLPDELDTHYNGWYLGESLDPVNPDALLYTLFYLTRDPHLNKASGIAKDDEDLVVLVGSFVSTGESPGCQVIPKSRLFKNILFDEVYRLTDCRIRSPLNLSVLGDTCSVDITI